MLVPPQAEPALKLRRYLDGGALFTPWAEARCGQAVTADVERVGPLWLSNEEVCQFGMAPDESRAALRRRGRLVQADTTEVARITSVVSVGRARQVDDGLIRQLTTTDIPLGKALGERGHSKVLWCSVGICEYAVACGRLILAGDLAVAVTTEWVCWSWLGEINVDN